MDGIAVIDKPCGWTSHDVVAKCRRVLGTRKIGHSGTLDPDATGVLVLGVGRATRLLRFITALPKTYETEIVLGIETDTLDDSGTITAQYDMKSVTKKQVRAAAKHLTGNIMQQPPMVSAVKVKGRRLYELARSGIEVERPKRPVSVYQFHLDQVAVSDAAVVDAAVVWHASVSCSSGTYIRVLAADLGALLGGGAHIRNLRRTSVGHFTLREASLIESPELLPMARAVSDLPSVHINADTQIHVRHGRSLSLKHLGLSDRLKSLDLLAVHDADGELLAVYEAQLGEMAKPVVVVDT